MFDLEGIAARKTTAALKMDNSPKIIGSTLCHGLPTPPTSPEKNNDNPRFATIEKTAIPRLEIDLLSSPVPENHKWRSTTIGSRTITHLSIDPSTPPTTPDKDRSKAVQRLSLQPTSPPKSPEKALSRCTKLGPDPKVNYDLENAIELPTGSAALAQELEKSAIFRSILVSEGSSKPVSSPIAATKEESPNARPYARDAKTPQFFCCDACTTECEDVDAESLIKFALKPSQASLTTISSRSSVAVHSIQRILVLLAALPALPRFFAKLNSSLQYCEVSSDFFCLYREKKEAQFTKNISFTCPGHKNAFQLLTFEHEQEVCEGFGLKVEPSSRQMARWKSWVLVRKVCNNNIF